MLSGDNKIVSDWLRSALKLGERQGLTKAALAARCQVKPQAIDGWLRTGRITKSNLAAAETFFGHGPSFTGSHAGVREDQAPYNKRAASAQPPWPFKLVSAAEISALPRPRIDRLDKLLRSRLDEWLEDDRVAGKRKAA